MATSMASSSLRPPRAKNLMPLSGIGLCEADSTTPKSAPRRLGEVGDARRRQHAEQQHVDARRREAGDHRGLQELPGDAGVAAHHGQRAVPLELAEVGEHVGGGHGQVQGQAGGEVTVGQAADAVRAEQASHWAAARDQRLLY